MQVTVANTDGLKRTLRVVVEAAELNERYSVRIGEIKERVHLKGFRKGKVPIAHIKKVFGRSLMSEVVQEAIRETSTKAIADRNERPAATPNIELTEGKDEIEEVFAGEADLAYSMSFEVIPDIKVMDLKSLQLERLVASVDESAVQDALANLVERNVRYETEEARSAVQGDRVTIDFKGSIDGEPFEGGAGEDLTLVMGSAGFIPGFEEGVLGARGGEERNVEATFPADYPVQRLRGKKAVFQIKVKTVEKPLKPSLDDDFAKSLGVDSQEKLRALIGEQIGKENEALARMRLKKDLLDTLESEHTFDLPPSLVEREFDAIWKQVNERLKQAGKTFEDEGQTEEEAREAYRKIAERRVRLGLVVGEIGEKNKITVSQDELRAALVEQARRYPGHEKQVYEYYEKTPGALGELRAPIFEDKVVAHILGVAKIRERPVSREELVGQSEETAHARTA